MANVKATVKIKDVHIDRERMFMRQRIDRALTAVGQQAVGDAAALAPLDTGLLKNSIAFALGGEGPNIDKYRADGKGQHSGREPEEGSYSGTAPKDDKDERSVYIGTNVEYAAYQEMGTSQMTSPNPFLGPGIKRNKQTYRDILIKYLSV